MKQSCFISNPNLPHNRVTTAVIGEKYHNTAKYLTDIGVEVLFAEINNDLDEEINSHADLELLHIGNNIIFVDEKQKLLIHELCSRGAKLTEIGNIKSPYPKDTRLNKAIIGDYIIGNFQKCDLDLPIKRMQINAKQGYCKCNICVINEKAIITEDKGIASLLKKYQFDVLLIEGNQILLSDHHFGFLGGASGKLDKETVFFNGNLEEHTNYKEIINFLNNHQIKPIYDKSQRLTDIGGIIPLMEII